MTNWVYAHMMRTVQGARNGTTEMEVEFRGSRFRTSASDITITPTLRDGTYERAELDAWLECLRPGDFAVDVGANVGVFTVLTARHVGAAGHVEAFEPETRNLARLQANLVMNELDNVSVTAACVGDTDGLITLYLQDGQSGTHSVIRAERTGQAVETPVVKLDTVIKRRPVAAMKIDVEGFEAAVLQGARSIILADRPAILVEYNGGPEQDALLIELMTTAGYDDCAFISRRLRRPISSTDVSALEPYAGLGNVLLRSRAATGVG